MTTFTEIFDGLRKAFHASCRPVVIRNGMPVHRYGLLFDLSPTRPRKPKILEYEFQEFFDRGEKRDAQSDMDEDMSVYMSIAENEGAMDRVKEHNCLPWPFETKPDAGLLRELVFDLGFYYHRPTVMMLEKIAESIATLREEYAAHLEGRKENYDDLLPMFTVHRTIGLSSFRATSFGYKRIPTICQDDEITSEIALKLLEMTRWDFAAAAKRVTGSHIVVDLPWEQCCVPSSGVRKRLSAMRGLSRVIEKS